MHVNGLILCTTHECASSTQAMDTSKNGELAKHEFVDWLNKHKPKKGPWAKLPALLKAFNMHKVTSITRAGFQTSFAAAKGLEVSLFEFKIPLFDTKAETCTNFCRGMVDQSAVSARLHNACTQLYRFVCMMGPFLTCTFIESMILHVPLPSHLTTTKWAPINAHPNMDRRRTCPRTARSSRQASQ